MLFGGFKWKTLQLHGRSIRLHCIKTGFSWQYFPVNSAVFLQCMNYFEPLFIITYLFPWLFILRTIYIFGLGAQHRLDILFDCFLACSRHVIALKGTSVFFFHKTVRVCHVYCNFKIGFTCRITVIFGTLKDGSLLNNTLASNICFSYRNMFHNGIDALSKIVDAFLSNGSKFHLVRIIR